MTEENKKANVAQEVAEALRTLSEAETLYKKKLYKGAVSRAYYAALHNARALLLSLGLEAKTHAGVAHLVSLHFVKSGRMEPATASLLPHLETDRVSSDYDAASAYTREMARDRLKQARTYGEAVRVILQHDGYL